MIVIPVLMVMVPVVMVVIPIAVAMMIIIVVVVYSNAPGGPGRDAGECQSYQETHQVFADEVNYRSPTPRCLIAPTHLFFHKSVLSPFLPST